MGHVIERSRDLDLSPFSILCFHFEGGGRGVFFFFLFGGRIFIESTQRCVGRETRSSPPRARSKKTIGFVTTVALSDIPDSFFPDQILRYSMKLAGPLY